MQFGERKNPLPSVGLLLAEVVQYVRSLRICLVRRVRLPSFSVPSESTLAQPLSTLLSEFISSFYTSMTPFGTVFVFSPDAPSGNGLTTDLPFDVRHTTTGRADLC